MSKKKLHLDDYIYSSIYTYPILYHKQSFKDSRLSVLNHLFLVNGNGVFYNPKHKNFNCRSPRKSISEKSKDRIKNGEKIVEAYYGGERTLVGNRIYLKYHGDKDVTKLYFYDDFLKLNIKYLKSFQEIPDDFDKSQINSIPIVEIYPLQEESNFKPKPYPYSLEYVPMWDREAKKLIPKSKILKDWREGIVEAYQWALNWMKSPEFIKDNYYNFALKVGPGCMFTNNWNMKTSIKSFCESYGIEYKKYSNPKNAAMAVVEKRRKDYIDTAKKIIQHYS